MFWNGGAHWSAVFLSAQILWQRQSGGVRHDYHHAPAVFLAMYEKDGQPLEVIASHFIQAKFVRPKIRPYQTDNYYDVLLRQYQLEREVEQIVFQKENEGKRNKNAHSSQSKTAERN